MWDYWPKMLCLQLGCIYIVPGLKVNCLSAGGNVKACYTSDLLNAHRIPC